MSGENHDTRVFFRHGYSPLVFFSAYDLSYPWAKKIVTRHLKFECDPRLTMIGAGHWSEAAKREKNPAGKNYALRKLKKMVTGSKLLY
jgi:hypothetical protein